MFIGIAIALSVGLLALLVLGWWYFFVDIDPPDDSDLVIERSEVADEDNGFIVLAEIHREEIDPAHDGWLTTYWQDGGKAVGVVEDELTAREGLLDAFDRSLERPEFQVPEVKLTTEYDSGHLMTVRRLAYLTAARARWLREIGRVRESITRSLDLLQFGRRIQGGEGAVLTWLVGAAVESMAFEQLASLVNESSRSRVDVDAILEAVERRYPASHSLAASLRFEYAAAAHAHEQGDLGIEDSVLEIVYLPNETKSKLVEIYRVLLDNMERLPAERRPPPFPEAQFTLRNYAGLQLVNLQRGIEDIVENLDKLHFRIRALRTLAALRVHHLRKGSLPDTLEDLVPEILSAVPRDPHDGEPLRYSREKRLIWSVGEDLWDDGGDVEGSSEAGDGQSEENFLMDGADLGLRIAF